MQSLININTTVLLSNLANILAIVSFVIYILRFIVKNINMNFPIKNVYFNENIIPINKIKDDKIHLIYGEQFTFKINLSVKFEKVIIENFNMYVEHGLGPEYFSRYFSSEQTIYIYTDYNEINSINILEEDELDKKY